MTESAQMKHRWNVEPGKYFLAYHVPGANFDEVTQRVTALLKEQGFGVLTTIDVAATMKEKLGEDLAPYLILGACNPPLAFEALTQDPGIGSLLPCNVVVAQEADSVFVGSVDPEAMFSVVKRDEMKHLAREVKQRLVRALAPLTPTGEAK
jgi:uncharacterized protein (DUF302 family)